MKISTAAAVPTSSSVRKQEVSPDTGSGDVYERQTYRADQRQQMSRKEILEYLRSRGMEI